MAYFNYTPRRRQQQQPPSPVDDLMQAVSGNATRLQAAGVPAEDLPNAAEKPGGLRTIFKALNVPGAAVRSGIQELIDPEQNEFWRHLWEDQEGASGASLLRAIGVPNIENKYMRGAANFAAELATDPLTIFSGGIFKGLSVAAPFAKGAAKLTGKGLLQPALEGAARRLSGDATSSLLQAVSRRVPLVREAGKVFGAVDPLDHITSFDSYRAAERSLGNRIGRRQVEAAGYLRNLLGGLDEAEGRKIVDTLEGLVPESPLSERGATAVEGLRNVFKQVGDEEQVRGILGTLRDNYFPHLKAETPTPAFGQFKPFTVNDPNTLARKIEGPLRDLATKHNFLYEPGTPTLVRQMRAIKATETFDFFKDVLGRRADDATPLWSVALPEAEQMATAAGMDLPDWLKATNRELWHAPPKLGALKEVFGDTTFAMDKAMRADLDRVVKMYTDDESINTFVKWFDGAQNWWKRWVTLRNPGFHINNFIGNTWNMYLGGLRNPGRLRDAGLVLADKPFTLQLDRAVTIDGVKKSVLETADIKELAMDHGVLGNDLYQIRGNAVDKARELLGSVAQPSRFQKFRGGYDRLMRAGGQAIEDDARLALFLDRLIKNDTAEEAANWVNKYLFDYRNGFSGFEQQVMRRVFPFYAWTRRNLPLQVTELMQQPGSFLNYDRAKRAVESTNPVEEDDRPAYLNEAVRLPVTLPNGQQLFFNPRLPLQDIQKIPGLSGDEGRGFLGSLTPFLRSPIEQITNFDLFTGKPIERYEGQTVAVGLPGLGQIGRVPARGVFSAKTARDFLGVANKAGDLTRLFTPDTNPADYLRVARFALPGVYTYDPQQQRLNALYELNRRLTDRIRKVQDESGQLVPTLKEAQGKQLTPAEQRRRQAQQAKIQGR